MRDRSNSQRVRGAVGGLQLLLRHWFIPEDVTPDYYHFTFWRMFQRFVAGTINVFGTQVGWCVAGVGGLGERWFFHHGWIYCLRKRRWSDVDTLGR